MTEIRMSVGDDHIPHVKAKGPYDDILTLLAYCSIGILQKLESPGYPISDVIETYCALLRRAVRRMEAEK